jgi:polyferredoxin
LRLEQPATFFFQLDPLVGISSLLSGQTLIKGFLWGAGIVVLSMLLGRVFCGFLCPLGTLHHAVGTTKPALKGSRMVQANQKTSSQRLKYFLLIFMLAGSLLGLNMAGALRAVFDALAASDFKMLSMLSYAGEVLVSPVFGYTHQAYQTGWFIGLIFLVILFLNRIRPRFWCRTLRNAPVAICVRSIVRGPPLRNPMKIGRPPNA